MRNHSLFMVLILLTFIKGNGQQVAYFNDGSGKAIYFAKDNARSEGSPYLYDEYKWGIMQMTDGKRFLPLKLKVNVFNGDVQFLSDTGDEMLAVVPIASIAFYGNENNSATKDTTWIVGLPAAINDKNALIAERLVDGKIKLCKTFSVTCNSQSAYGQAGTVNTYTNGKRKLIAVMDGKTESVKFSQDFVLQLCSDKQTEMQAYFRKSNNTCKSEHGLIEAFAFYNKL
jgi:hypothetical protein